MARKSAGLLMFRRTGGELEVFLVHMGGPYWARREEGAWSIPKGEYGEDEAPLDAARREFHEETGFTAAGPFTPLTPIRQSGGKLVTAWAFAGDADPAKIQSNTYPVEWPPHSGQWRQYPEVDRADWFSLPGARVKIIKAQAALLDELERIIAGQGG